MTRIVPFLAVLAFPVLASAQAPRFALEGNRLVLPGPVEFEAGTAKLTPAGEKALAHAADYLAAKPDVTLVRLEGHVEAGAKDGQRLSADRAMAAARFLVSKGVDCKRLLPVAFGDTKPVDSNATPEGRGRNRRIEVVNATLRGRSIGGMPIDGGAPLAGDPCGK